MSDRKLAEAIRATTTGRDEFDALKDAVVEKLDSVRSDVSDVNIWQFGPGKEGVLKLATLLAQINKLSVPCAPF